MPMQIIAGCDCWTVQTAVGDWLAFQPDRNNSIWTYLTLYLVMKNK